MLAFGRELSMTLVDLVCKLLDLGVIDLPSKLLGRQKKLSKIKDDIMKSRHKGIAVTSVEIRGIGGSGKTTFAKFLYKDICSEFDRHCFIEDVSGIIQKDGIKAVQNQVILKLLRYEPRADFGERKQLLKKRLHNANILVVLDNVDSKNRASDIFINDDVSINPASTIIVTSREREILKRDGGFERYCEDLITTELLRLSFDESKELFCDNAFKKGENLPHEFNDLVNKIVDKCHGNPLALVIFGKHVYGGDRTEWEDFWSAMQDSLPSDLQKILRTTYDDLSVLEKRLFLDVAIFLRREKVDILENIWKDDRGRFPIALKNLKKKNLVQVSWNGYLRMHDVLVDMAKTIVDDESQDDIGQCTHLWHPSNVKDVLLNKKGTHKVKGLSLVYGGSVTLDMGENGEPLSWPAEAFAPMSSLEFLIAQGDCIRGDLSNLSKKLLWLRWTGLPYECLPPTLCLKCVRVLDVPGGKQSSLWEHPHSPVNLRQMNTRDCNNLRRLPEFTCMFQHLSSLQLSGCSSLEVIPESFGFLNRLQTLELQNCNALQRFPDSFGFLQGLQSLEMRNCSALERFPESFGNLRNLLRLLVTDCDKLQCLPNSFGELAGIQDLRLESCRNLEIASDSFGCITTLRCVSILNCKVPELPGQLSQQSCLELLDVKNNTLEDVCLPKSFWPKHLEGFPSGKWKPHYAPFFPYQSISLTGLCSTRVRGFDHSLSQVHELVLGYCCYMQELLQFIDRLPLLTKLTFAYCITLQELPHSIGNLKHLQEMNILSCWSLKKLPEEAGNLHSLETVKLLECPIINGLQSVLGNLSELKLLELADCWMVDVVDMSALFNLEYLTLDRCHNLRSVLGLSNLSNLHKLTIHDCLNLQSISCPSVSSLQFLSVQRCSQLVYCDGFASLLNTSIRLDVCLDLDNAFEFLRKLGLYSGKSSINLLSAQTDECLKFNAKVCPFVLDMGMESSHPWFVRTLSEYERAFPICDFGNRRLINAEEFNVLIFFFVSEIYGDEFPQYIPPQTEFRLRITSDCNSLCSNNLSFKQFNWGEEIHFGIWLKNEMFENSASLDISMKTIKQVCHEPYAALVKELCVIPTRPEEAVLLFNTISKELKKAEMVSRAWSELPSQLCLLQFSAPDVANCTITKLYCHFNTSLVEEEMGLTLKKKRFLFRDDQAMLHSTEKRNFVTFNASDCDCDVKAMTNVYEMAILISSKGRVGRTRKLQQHTSISEERIPAPIYAVLSSRLIDYFSIMQNKRRTL